MDGNQASVDALTAAFRAGEGLPTGPAATDHDHNHGHDPAALDPDRPDPGAARPGVSTSSRRFEHRGHAVRIDTTYRITIDDQPLLGHVEVLPSGAVHYHAFPQYAPASAVDVVKTVIDTVWDRPAVPDELAPIEAAGDDWSGT